MMMIVWLAYDNRQEHKTTCKISEKVQDMAKVTIIRTNRKSHTHFWLVPTSMTLNDRERLKRHSCKVAEINKISGYVSFSHKKHQNNAW